MLCKRSKEPNETLRIFKNVIVDFSIFFICIETNVHQSIKENIKKSFVRKLDLKHKYH